MGNVPREELLFTQLLIRSGLITIEQYQEILEIRTKILEQTGVRKALDKIIIDGGFLDEKVVKNLWQKLQYIPSTSLPAPAMVQEPSKEKEIGRLSSEDILDNPPVPPQYRLGTKLGEGAMGAVFKAYQVQDNREVAIKFLDPRYNRDKELLHRFMREAKAISQLQHPNIVKALEVGEQSGVYYFAMEYVPGRSLAKILSEQGRLPEKRSLCIVLQVARALQYAHQNGFIHRDIKPENVMVDEADTAKLCDFGLIRGTEKETLVTQVGAFMGTPQYVSPEQAKGVENLDVRTDIYSLGCTLYHMVTGQPPYAHSNPVVVLTWQATKPFPDPLEVAPNLSNKLVSLIKKMTAKDRDLRVANMESVVQKLEETLENASEIETTPPRTSSNHKRSTKEISIDTDRTKGKRSTARRRKLKEKESTSSPSSKLRESSSSYISYKKLRETEEQNKRAQISALAWWICLCLAIVAVLVWQAIKHF